MEGSPVHSQPPLPEGCLINLFRKMGQVFLPLGLEFLWLLCQHTLSKEALHLGPSPTMHHPDLQLQSIPCLQTPGTILRGPV